VGKLTVFVSPLQFSESRLKRKFSCEHWSLMLRKIFLFLAGSIPELSHLGWMTASEQDSSRETVVDACCIRFQPPAFFPFN